MLLFCTDSSAVIKICLFITVKTLNLLKVGFLPKQKVLFAFWLIKHKVTT